LRSPSSSKFHGTDILQSYHGSCRCDLLDGSDKVVRQGAGVALHHAQGSPSTQVLNRPQVYPSGDETRSERAPKRVPRYPFEP